jgi:hypothetical protein
MLLWPLVTVLGLDYQTVAHGMSLGEIAQAHAVMALKIAFEEEASRKAT